ncbi:hypothetical protein H4582DRAFT_103050 [Lactarius indigo]|nr:hypothetical protein H4582DRAFT_103050 [Lactarius indigo]
MTCWKSTNLTDLPNEGVATFMIRSFFSAQIIFFSICFFLCLLAWAMYAIDLGCPDLSAHTILCHACIAHLCLRVILLGYCEGAAVVLHGYQKCDGNVASSSHAHWCNFIYLL